MQLLDDPGTPGHLALIAPERDLVTPGDDPARRGLEQTQILVVPTQEGAEIDLGGRAMR